MPTFFGKSFGEVFSTNDIFTDALRKSTLTENPQIIPEIDLVFVLSGRSTVLGGDADNLRREHDIADDLERVREGIRIATQINALRAGKTPAQLKRDEMVTPIFYNGRPIHNKHLRKALKIGLLPYPKELFIIHDIKPENTIGQIQSFKEYLLYTQHKNIAVVSSSYHIPRVACILGNESPQVSSEDIIEHLIHELNIFLFGVHKQKIRPGIVHDIQGEYKALKNYSQGDNPSIARDQSPNTYMNFDDFVQSSSFRRVQFWAKVPVQLSLENCAIEETLSIR